VSGAHRVAWWGALDPFTFVVWIAARRFDELPRSRDASLHFLNSLANRPGEAHVAYLNSLDQRHRPLAATAFTAYAHEWRHWYDLTSTPYGIARTAVLTDFYLALLDLDEEVLAMPEVFVPLTTWSSRPEIVHAAFPHLRPLSPAGDHVLRQALSRLRASDRALLNPERVGTRAVSPLQMLESLAMLEQERLAADLFGPEVATAVRRQIASVPGQGYYVAVDLVTEAFGADRPDIVKAVIEGALHSDVRVQVVGERITPGIVLNAMLAVPRQRMRSDPQREIEIVIERLLGRPPEEMVADAYVLVAQWLAEVLSALPSAETPTSRLRRELIRGIESAVRWGTAVRLGLEHTMFHDAWLDADFWQVTPTADPYDFPAPVVVESATGWFVPKAYARKHGYLPIAGPEASGRTFLTAYPNMKVFGLFRGAKRERCVDLTVWTPRRDSASMDIYAYLNLPSLLPELMYWRGLVFGPGAISPKTFSSTTLAQAYERGQRLRGPRMTSPPKGPIDDSRLRHLVKEASRLGGFDAVTDLLVHAQFAEGQRPTDT
jgi:hypothetical protein